MPKILHPLLLVDKDGIAPPETADTIRYEDVVCRQRFGGLLKSYSRKGD